METNAGVMAQRAVMAGTSRRHPTEHPCPPTIAEFSHSQQRSEKVFDTQTACAVKFTYQINERRAYPL